MNELFGIFKKFANDNSFSSLAKTLNSAKTSKDTKESLKPLTEAKENHTAHGANFYIHNGVCYTTFIHNYGELNDDPFCKTLFFEMGIFSLEKALSDSFDYKKDVKVITFDNNSDIIGDINATSTFNCNSLFVIGDTLHITFGGQVDGDRFVLYHTEYDTKAEAFTVAKETRLIYKGKTLPLDDYTLNEVSNSEGVISNAHGMPQLTNKWNEYRGEYYTAFMIDGPGKRSALVVKTQDFDSYDFVSMVPETENAGAEIASCIYEGHLYTACRQKWTVPYLLMNRYDIEAGTWCNSYPIEDGTSRPWFFIHKNEVYLYNTIEEAARRYANISKVRTDRVAHNFKTFPINTVATIYGCGSYHSFYEYKERVYFVCSYKGTVSFGELKLKEYDAERVNEKLLSLFEE